MTARHCDMAACKLCTACAHDRHDDCARDVTCPTTGEVFVCRCCGANRRNR